MNGAGALQGDLPRDELAALCADHLRQEEVLLNTALPLVRAVKEAFHRRGFEPFAAALSGHEEFGKLSEAMNLRRQRFRDALARTLKMNPQEVTFTRALAHLPRAAQAAIAADMTRIRRMADELAATQYWISVHLRIHLEAYRRILRDLTNTSTGSGRYGRAGKAETLEYRPLIQIHG